MFVLYITKVHLWVSLWFELYLDACFVQTSYIFSPAYQYSLEHVESPRTFIMFWHPHHHYKHCCYYPQRERERNGKRRGEGNDKEIQENSYETLTVISPKPIRRVYGSILLLQILTIFTKLGFSMVQGQIKGHVSLENNIASIFSLHALKISLRKFNANIPVSDPNLLCLQDRL